MKFLIDAQLPLRLSDLLTEANHDSIHTSSLPDGNRTGERRHTRRSMIQVETPGIEPGSVIAWEWLLRA
jgi:hypothetical protein